MFFNRLTATHWAFAFASTWRILSANNSDSDPEVIKLFSCSTQLSMKFQMLISINSGSDKLRMLFFLLIKVKMSTTVGILTIMSRKNFMLS